MIQDMDEISVGTPDSRYKQLKDLHLLRDEVDMDDPSISSEDWIAMNRELERVAQEPKTTNLSSQEYDHLASGAAGLTTLTKIVSSYLTVDGQPFSFEGREYLNGIYNYFPKYSEGCKNTLLVASRQVEKSTTQSAKACALGIAIPSYKTLYIAPRYDQTTVFSNQRFAPMCENSPHMMGSMVRPGRTLWQVKARQFTNGSFFNFRSCYLNADGSRGISADQLLIDEIQDIQKDAIPVLEQCQSHAPKDIRYNLYAGTPKTTANTITLRWHDTCQFTWLVKCRHCNYTDNMCNETMVGDHFYECLKCKQEVYPAVDGRWVPKNPSLLDVRWGFHLSQIMVPFKDHSDIVAVRNDRNTSRGKYLNETLGLPYDEGEAGITDKMLHKACKDYHMHSPEEIKRLYTDVGLKVYAGIDYGSGLGDNPSFTVLAIGVWTRTDRFKVLYVKKFIGHESDTLIELDLIDKICKTAGVHWIGADHGYGSHQNQRLSRERGWDRNQGQHMMLEYEYVGSQKAEMTYNFKAQRYTVDRNKSIERMMDAVRNCDDQYGIILPNYGECEFFKMDLMALKMEYNEKTNRYKYDHKLPDDAFHAINYAYMASRQGQGMGLRVGFFN